MIAVRDAAIKYGLPYTMVQNWVNSGYLNTVEAYPGTGRRNRAFELREEQVLEAMAALHKAGVKTGLIKFLARGSSAHIRQLELALDKCKVVRAALGSLASGG